MQAVGIAVVVLVVAWAMLSVSMSSSQSTALPALKLPPPGHRYVPNVERSAVFGSHQPTRTTGMSWNSSWQLPRANDGAFLFQTNIARGLLVGLGEGMSDQSPGYVLQLGMPQGEKHVAAISQLHKPDVATQILELTVDPKKVYWVRVKGRQVSLGEGSDPNSGELFTIPLPAYGSAVHEWGKHIRPHDASHGVLSRLRYFGFGTSTHSHRERGVTDIKIIAG